MIYPAAAGGLCFAQSGAGAGGSCAERDVSLTVAIPHPAAPCLLHQRLPSTRLCQDKCSLSRFP